MRPGGLRVLINWGDACTLFWGDKPPICDLLKMHFLIKKFIRKMHVQSFKMSGIFLDLGDSVK